MERENYRDYNETDVNFNSETITEDNSDMQSINEPSNFDFQKNAGDNQDQIEDKDNDPNRRTLDEYDVNDAEPNEDENDLYEDDSEEEE